MAMVLQPSRIRLTQAIYFGRPAGFGVTSIADGNGIAATPNPIITTGTIALGTLTSDHDFGNFNIHSRNSISVFNIVAYGADETGVADSSAAIVAAIAACQAAGGGVVYFPPGQFRVVQVGAAVPFVITAGNLSILGAGRTVSNISFEPAGGGAVFQFNNGAVPINYNRIADISFRSPDTTIQKTMILAYDLNNFIVERVSNTAGIAWTGGAGIGSIGVHFRGRQELRMRDCEITADQPVHIDLNPNHPISFDHSSVESSDFLAGIVTDPVHYHNPSIRIATGALMSNSVFRQLACVGGNGAIYWNDTTGATSHQVIEIDNIRTEQSDTTGGHTTEYEIDISSVQQIQGLSISNVYSAGLINGIRLVNAKWPVVKQFTYTGAGTFVNFSATVDGPVLIGCFAQVGSTITDASISPTTINYIKGGNLAVSGFGTLSPPLAIGVGLTVSSKMQVGSTTAGTGSQIDVVNNSDVTTEGLEDLYLRSGAGATNVGMRIGTDKTRNTGFIQTIEPSTSYATKTLSLNPNGGNVGVGTVSATRTLDLAGTQRYRGQTAPAVSEANSGTIYFDSATNKLKASLNGGAYVDVIGSGGLTGSGTTGQVAYWDSVTSLASPSGVYVDAINNRLGINVPAPSVPLEVNGDINLNTWGSKYSIGPSQEAIIYADNQGRVSVGLTIIGGLNNTLIGNSAGAGSTGIENTAVGSNALNVTTTGTSNTALGYAAGLTNTTGINNIFIGSGADATVGNLTSAGAIGFGATVAQDNSLNIGGAILGVGIGTPTPKTTLHVVGSFAVSQYEITLVNGLNSDIAPITTTSAIRIIGPTGAFSIGGFLIGTGIPAVTGPTGGQMLYVFNSEAQQMTIVNEDLLSGVTARIKTLTGGDVVLRAGTSAATFMYDDSLDRWLLISSN